MRPQEAYAQNKQTSMPRIDVILALYRMALDRLDRAAGLLTQQQVDLARPLLGLLGSTQASLPSDEEGT